MAQECLVELVGLSLLIVALLMSMCLNLFLCIKRRAYLLREKDNYGYPRSYEGEGPSQVEGHYFHDLNHREQQENPIYGNISTDRTEVCYEMMTMQHTRDRFKHVEPDLNYASLDLKLAKKRRKKHRQQQDQTRGRGNCQDHLPGQLTPTMNSFLELEGDGDTHLPPRDTSTMVSHSSIYLNSQQIAQETEETERERAMNVDGGNVDWEGMRTQEDRATREWIGEHEGDGIKDRQGVDNVTACAQLSDIQSTQSGADPFISNFSYNSNQQD
ncbi:uncharacterized protein LOC115054532 [Echeneis naucrates]|uniref:uncharacterized protein LOC115054532 n=1 Tax=Echeneis naucrates TaxID=173247 RepID=UPI001113BEFC|nr:uncharacterized protein LOC115054532 [Echeneis naucrates]